MKISKKLVGVLVGVIASIVFIPNVFAEEISTVDITLVAPQDGETITVGQTPCMYEQDGEMVEGTCNQLSYSPIVMVNGDSNSFYTTTNWVKKLPSEVLLPAPNPEDYDTEYEFFEANAQYRALLDAQMYYTDEEIDGLTFVEGEEYRVAITLVPFTGSSFVAENFVATVNEEVVDMYYFNPYEVTLFVKVTATQYVENTEEQDPQQDPQENPQDPQDPQENPQDPEENENKKDDKKDTKEEKKDNKKEETKETKKDTKKTIDVLDGAKQSYDATGKDRLKFRFDIPLATFKKSGKVFMDGKEVDPKNYDLEEGSTIVIFTKAFTDELKAGNHTVKITTDEGEAETTFNVTKSVANPKTADNLVIYGFLIIVALLGFAISRNEVFNKQN